MIIWMNWVRNKYFFMGNIQFGGGIFSVPETSMFLGLPRGKVHRWLDEVWNTRIKNQ